MERIGVDLLENPVRDYAWGSRTHLPRLLGAEPDGRPWAELWMGSHPTAPSRLSDGRSLREVIAADPEGWLGTRLSAVYDGRLPFLMKLLAAAEPLSLQVHPTTDRARIRWAEQNAAGLAVDAPERTYPDPTHKPEMILALTRFEGMAGFRDPVRTAAILRGLRLPWLDRVAATLESSTTPFQTLRAVVTELLSRSGPSLEADLAELRDAALAAESASHTQHVRPRTGASDDPSLVERESVRVYAAVARLVDRYPADPGVLVTLLLNHVVLAAGEAMFIDAGVIHAYTSGFGVEIMAESDNVLRAGLTVKHVDVPELLQVTNFNPMPPPLWEASEISLGRATGRLYAPPVDEFELVVADVTGPVDLPAGPQVLLCLHGELTIEGDQGQVTAREGQAVVAGDRDGRLSVRGSGRLVVGRGAGTLAED
jgi:mannose-6-phosphate isomerase